VQLYICCETLEHLDDPETVLKAIRSKTQNLVLSTPVDAWRDITNPEHYWAWDRAAVEEMLRSAGFTVAVYNALDLRPAGGEYCFGIWWCR
jgi:2-polyprenyl-3-methyl-5-hydroxy-6-metoxy-1,4-benzoquinol methylase